MKIYKCMVAFSDENTGSIYKMDAIEHQGMFWLVPQWLQSQTEQISKPARMICLSLLSHQEMIGSPLADFVLSSPIPKAVAEGRETSSEYVVLESPDIRIPILH